RGAVLLVPRHRPARDDAPGPGALGRGAIALLERNERHRVPVSDRLAGARGRREPRRLRPDAAHAGVRDEARIRRPRRRAVHAVRHRARGLDRADLRRAALRRLRRGGRERPGSHGPAPPPRHRAREGGNPPADPARRGHGDPRAHALRGVAPAVRRRARRQRADRPPLPPPGRDRDAVGVHDRRADARGRDGHRARPRLARTGAAPDRRRRGVARRGSRPSVANSEDVRAFVIAAGCAALVAGCGGGSTTTTTVTVTHTVTRTRTVTAENAPTTTTTAAAPCLASALAGTFTTVPGSAGAGQITYRLRLTNQGDAACYVAGVPEGRLVGRDGRTLPTNIGPAKPSDSTAGRAVITPGGAATADARFSPD